MQCTSKEKEFDKMKFKIDDVIMNLTTKRRARVIDIERQWAYPVYALTYMDDESGFRFNENYEKNWILVGEM